MNVMLASMVFSAFIPLSFLFSVASAAEPDSQQTLTERGEYLVNYGGCHDCHTPKVFTPNGPELDPERLLSGYRADAALPDIPQGVIGPDQWGALTNNDLTAWAGPWGVSFAANLTPHKTGMGGWTEEMFIKTMRTGKHLGVGRDILPPMPWHALAMLSDSDLRAIFVYLSSIEPIENHVPQPVPPSPQ